MKLNKKNFIKYLNKNYIFENNPNVAVAVSGGPDSMALIFLLKDWILSKKGKLIALIFDHRIRKESFSEAKIIKNYLIKFKIKSKIIRASKNKVLKYNMNEARNNRFKGLIQFCKRHKILHLFFAHHYDDNLETFLTRRVSGSNLEGLACMRSVSIRDKITIIRPLLNYSKADILKYNNKKNILYISDPSNYNLKYTRIAIRQFIHSTDKIKLIKKDFRKLKQYVYSYKKMILEIFHTLTYKSNKNSIEINYLDVIKQNDLVIERHIHLIYNFFYRQKKNLRSSKIQYFINNLRKKGFKKYNIGSLLMTKNDGLLKFFVKKL